jgi:hypothetical protein
MNGCSKRLIHLFLDVIADIRKTLNSNFMLGMSRSRIYGRK